MINSYENKRIINKTQDRKSIHFWLVTILQFTFGGLLSTYLVFYFRSTTLSVTWPFLLILAVAFIANERFKHHYDRLTFQISLFYMAIFAFSIFIIPVIVRSIEAWVFITSGIVSLFIIWIFLKWLKRVAKERFIENRKALALSICGIFITVNVLYFFNLIPPIPLSLKYGGIYHDVSKNSAGNYVLLREPKGWLDYFSINKKVHLTPGEYLYAYSAIFSPAAFRTDILHEWQYFDEKSGSWVTTSIVTLPTVGGREGGYRTYSRKSDLSLGKWRVNVETKNGKVVGRLGFNVVPYDPSISYITVIAD
jgi:hypothetical protein